MRFTALLLVLLAVGASAAACAPAVPPKPPSPVPTPQSVTRENPGGDADDPLNAALRRLLEQPWGSKHDKFLTLSARFPDIGNWRRVRFWGYPTRAGFRYGDDHFAIAVLSYTDAEGSDSPASCLERFVTRSQRIADGFDVELEPLRRGLGKHRRGVESLTPEQRARWPRRPVYSRRSPAGQRSWPARRPRQRRPAGPRDGAAADSPSTAAPDQARPQGAGAAADLAAKRDEAGASRGAAVRPHPPRTPPGKAQPRRPAANDAAARERRRAMRERFRRLLNERLRRARQRERYAPMPVIRTGGQVRTLLNDDRYTAAVVAYRSWPGTCLVQGFAVRVGTDPALAAAVVDRWVAEGAGQLSWRWQLREAPTRQNR